jgi:hypothetical protein
MWRPCNNGHVYSRLDNIYITYHQPNASMDKDCLHVNVSGKPIRRLETCSLDLIEVSGQWVQSVGSLIRNQTCQVRRHVQGLVMIPQIPPGPRAHYLHRSTRLDAAQVRVPIKCVFVWVVTISETCHIYKSVLLTIKIVNRTPSRVSELIAKTTYQ